MRKLFLLLIVLIALSIPCFASAATVSGTLTQISNHSMRYLEKITIVLESKAGDSVQTVTDQDGKYRFTGVSQGEYRITAKIPRDHVPALMGKDNWLLPSQNNNAVTDWFKVDGNQEINLASTRATVFVKFIAFIDENANGGRMNSEPLLRDVEVSLYPAGRPDIMVASGITDRKGELTLDNLSPGEYQAKVVFPENYSSGPLGTKVSIYYNCINASDTQEAWSEPFTVSSGSQGIGIGAVVTGSAQGHIWFDADNDGRKNKSEQGLSNVKVTLTGQENNLTRTTVTDQNGAYAFSRLQPGSYTVKVTAPDGYMFADAGGDSWLTQGYSDTDYGTIEVSAERTAQIPEIGLMKATELQIVFYQDSNANGMKDSGEKAYPGANVIVTSKGKTVAEAISDAKGDAAVPIIRAGNVEVTARLNDPDIFSPAGIDNDFAMTVADSTNTVETILTPGQTTTLYAAVTLPAQIGGSIFMDSNNDGLREPEDGPAEGFAVQAVDWTGQLVAETVADASGTYHFDRLLPIPHTIRFMLSDPYIASPYSDNGSKIVSQNNDYGETDLLSPTPGSYTAEINAGLFKAGTISGHVLLTDDRPASMGAGLEGLKVTLIRPDGSVVSDYTTTLSEPDGSYYLKGILPGNYCLRYELPEDSLFAETDDLTVNSSEFTSSMGSDIRMPEIYAVRTATIEGQVTCEGEPADAVITAVNVENGYTVSFPAESSSGGHFALHLLRPGTWKVTAALEEGFSFAEDTDLVPAIAYHVSEKEYTFVMGDTLSGQQVLVTRPAVISGRLFLDENLSNAYDEDESFFTEQSVSLINRDGMTIAELVTDETGHFESPKLIPGRYQLATSLEDDCILLEGYQLSKEQWAQEIEAVSGQVTDAAVPILQFASISGKLWSLDESLDFVGGLEVQLFNADALSAPISVTKTDKQGNYRFARLYPGSYCLTVNLPEGHGFARIADTSETRVSLILSNNDAVMSDPLQLRMGVSIANADFGFGAKGSIGDFAWLDLNGNGMQDIGEPGIPGIKIQLIQGDELLGETETDLYGHYMFEKIYPGHYTLRVTMHPELKSTAHQTEFPMIGSVLPESDEATVSADDVIVPSGTRNLAVDIGFQLRKDGVYPAVMDTIPTTDWSFGGKKK